MINFKTIHTNEHFSVLISLHPEKFDLIYCLADPEFKARLESEIKKMIHIELERQEIFSG